MSNKGELVKDTTDFTLPNTIVTVKFIKRKQGMASNVNDDHVISGGMLSGSVKRFYTPLLRNGSIANVLTKEEKLHLEDLTGINLSVYGEFWLNHCVLLHKEDNIFDLSNPLDYISIAILKSYKNDIATSWKDRNQKQTYQFVITTENEEVNDKKLSYNTKMEAYKLYGKIEDDKDKLMGILSLLSNQSISKETELKWLQAKVMEQVDTNSKVFVELIKDSSLETKLLINEAVTKGVILKTSNKYKTIDGLDLCENGQTPSFDNAVTYLDNVKHQEVRSLIEAKNLKIK